MAEKTRLTAAQKNAAVLESLEPLQPGERPGAVTVAAVISVLLAIGNLVLLAIGTKVRGGTATPVGGLLFAFLMLAAAGGMWRAKYWAVLGFQALLGITLVISALSLVRASNLLGFLLPIVILAAGGTLFWKLIRAMARIQLPARPGDARGASQD